MFYPIFKIWTKYTNIFLVWWLDGFNLLIYYWSYAWNPSIIDNITNRFIMFVNIAIKSSNNTVIFVAKLYLNNTPFVKVYMNTKAICLILCVVVVVVLYLYWVYIF